MTPITEEILEECFYQGQFTKQGNKWKVITEHGRVFEFDDKGFDLSQCLTPLVPGETEEDREEMTFAACSFCQEVWGCVDVREMDFIAGGKMAIYAEAYEFTVDENTFREFGISDAKAVYGEAATVRNNWFPAGWRITVPDVGFVVIGMSGDELNVRRIEGNLYEETLRFLQKMQGHAVVRGKTQFCATWVAHGEALGGGIRVIPEIPRGLWSMYLLCHAAWFIGALVALPVWGIFPKLGFWEIALVAWAAASVAMGFLVGDDRKRGEVLLNKFPQMGSRNAKLDDARARGML